jgi:hypothetical protein
MVNLRRSLNVSHTLGCTGRNNSKMSIGSHGHAGDTRPGQTRKTPKHLSARVRRTVGSLGLCLWGGGFWKKKKEKKKKTVF